MNERTVKSYIDANKRLCLVKANSKSFLKIGWENIIESEASIMCHAKAGGNLKWVLSHGDLVLDVDPRNGGDDSLKRLFSKIQKEFEPTVITPSGGYHFYFEMPDVYVGRKFLKDNPKYKGIEFFCREAIKNAGVLIPGSKAHVKYAKDDPRNPKNWNPPANDELSPLGEYCFYDDVFNEFSFNVAPSALMEEFINYDFENKMLDKSKGLVSKPSYPPVNKRNVQEALGYLSPDVNYSQWIKIGMMIQDSNLDDWFDIWKEWSKKGESYKEGCCEVAAKSFKVGDGVTIGSLFYLAKEAKEQALKGAEKEVAKVADKLPQTAEADKVEGYLEKIAKGDEKEIRGIICPQIRKEHFAGVDSEKLIIALQGRFKELSGARFSKSSVRELVDGGNTRVVGELVSGFDGVERPKWCNKWIYVVSHRVYMDLETLRPHETEAFNIINGVFVPFSEGGRKLSASKYIMDNGFVSTVSTIGYFPTNPDLFVIYDNEKMINVFNHKKRPVPAQDFTKEGLDYIEALKKHIKLIFLDDNNSEIFICWLAHQVQYPGKKILWAPVIQSFQGLGKTFFRVLFEYCLGVDNVGVVSPSQAISDFNGWACNKLLNVLEELKIADKNGHVAINALKPLITDSSIQIRQMRTDPYKVNNTVNYICFTNYKDALPVDEGDRRFWINFSQFENIKEFEDFIGCNINDYYKILFDGISKFSTEVLKWLLDYSISEEFLSIKRAPDTESKRRVIATRDASIEGLDELKNLIEKGGTYFNKDVISSADLFNDFSLMYPSFNLGDHNRKHYLLKKLGYTRLDKQISIGNKLRSIWSKKEFSLDFIRNSLQITKS